MDNINKIELVHGTMRYTCQVTVLPFLPTSRVCWPDFKPTTHSAAPLGTISGSSLTCIFWSSRGSSGVSLNKGEGMGELDTVTGFPSNWTVTSEAVAARQSGLSFFSFFVNYVNQRRCAGVREQQNTHPYTQLRIHIRIFFNYIYLQ